MFVVENRETARLFLTTFAYGYFFIFFICTSNFIITKYVIKAKIIIEYCKTNVRTKMSRDEPF
jgi:hypothetical protein